MIFLIQEWLIVVLCFRLLAENENFDMLRLTNEPNELLTCTRHAVILMGERITVNTRKRLELCQYKVGPVPNLVKVLS
jgi:hypothetical protein